MAVSSWGSTSEAFLGHLDCVVEVIVEEVAVCAWAGPSVLLQDIAIAIHSAHTDFVVVAVGYRIVDENVVEIH